MSLGSPVPSESAATTGPTGLELTDLTIASPDPARLAEFWAGLLQTGLMLGRGAPAVTPTGVAFRLRFVPGPAEKHGPNQMHPDLWPASVEEQTAVVQRALDLGARHLDIGQGPEALHVVLADPDGNEMCVLEPGGSFLAGCPFFSSLAGDGPAEVGYFWRDALGWDLVWDHEGETAVQAPQGGPKITWGGEPIPPKRGRNRLHLDLTSVGPLPIEDQIERLRALGATSAEPVCADAVGFLDPGGNEFCLVRRAA